MSILCDFCGEVNSLENKDMSFVISNGDARSIAICEHCIAKAVDIVKENKNSEAPTAGTDEASGLVRNEQGNEL